MSAVGSSALLGGSATCLGAPAAAFAGIMALGMADAAASAIGIRFGCRPICNGAPRMLQTKVDKE